MVIIVTKKVPFFETGLDTWLVKFILSDKRCLNNFCFKKLIPHRNVYFGTYV